jgi:hypothetical protein
MADTGYLGETLIVVTGDHGSENQDLDKRGLPSDFSERLTKRGIAHVMADWHVYLLTLDVSSSVKNFDRGKKVSATFTITDDDTGAPVEGAVLRLQGVREKKARGTTDAEGKVTLEFTPARRTVRVRAGAEGFNTRVLRYRS